METSLHRLRQVERHAAPIAQRLIRGHIQTLEQNIAQAEAEFLRAEPVRAVREAYQIIADWLKQHPPEEPTA